MASSAPLPVLTDTFHSGIPARLLDSAARVRARLYSHRTLPPTHARTEVELPVLPPEITRKDFEDAIVALRDTVGGENVVINDQPLADGWYIEHPNTHDAYHIFEAGDSVSSAVVYPGSTDEVVAVVKWANKYEIPIYPISMGRNLGYGGAAPRVRGSVVVDLGKRMNTVLKIDGANCSCLVEPGVSYYKLYEEVQKTGLPLWIDPPDLGGGSVLGNAVDRGVGYTLYGDHFGNHCGMEVVLPTGDIVRTGMGALPGPDGNDNPTWQSFQYGYGPYADGIFTQSNFGIVTKMGFWLMPATEHLTFMLTFPREDDYEGIIDVLRELMVRRVLGNVPQLRHVIQELAVTGLPRTAFYSSGKGIMPREVIREHAKKLPCGDCSWVFYGTVYAENKDAVTKAFENVRDAFATRITGVRALLPSDVPEDHYLHARVRVCSGTPDIRELDWLNWVPNAGHLFFAPICPTQPKDARTLYTIVERAHVKYGFDLFPTYCVATREMHLIVNIVYDRADPDAKKRALACMREMIADSAAAGYGEYRTHLMLADQVVRTYGWNNNAQLRFHEALKDALDPVGILAPGRAGIWPKRYRGRGWELLPGDERTTSSPAK
ncbi:uncharacterized protein V1518DRAFT_435193 [Limtongia smithiae]|uniref:uncharacterized protein n=1 Tax=Limtongia smithiae TaxID=1125753 RepID=UPI0034CE9A4E